MAKSRRKASGCRRGFYKRKKMGKGWLAARKPRGRPKPVERTEAPAEEATPAES